jgi:peroxiredoxin
MERNYESGVDAWVERRLTALAPPEHWEPDVPAGLARLRRGRQAAGVRRRRGIVYAAAGAATLTIMLGGVMAFPVTRALAQRCVDACVTETVPVKTFLLMSLSRRGEGGLIPPQQRRIAPDFKLEDSSGRSVSLVAFRGSLVLLNFWATWCSPCKVEMPWFEEFQQRGDAVVLGVSMDDDGWKAVRPYIERLGVSYPVMIGNDGVAREYGGLQTLPTTVLIDKAGRIAVTHTGLVAKRTYEGEFRTLAEER